MSKKAKLLTLFTSYKKEYTECQELLKGIQANISLSEEGKAQEKKKVLDRLAASASKHHDDVTAIITDGLAALEGKWNKGTTGKLADAGYQAGLSNVLKMIELDAIQNEADIKNIIETYQGDFNAMATVKASLAKSTKPEVKKLAYLVPEDTRETTRKLLNQLQANVNSYMNETNVQNSVKSWNSFNTQNGNVAASMDGMMQFITDRLADDLEVVK